MRHALWILAAGLGSLLLVSSASAQLGPALAGRMAQADNAAVVNNNPAGITRVPGTQMVVDLGFAQSFSEFRVKQGTTNTGGNPDDDSDPVLIPTLSLSHQLTDRWSLGFGMFVPAGIGTDYGSDWAGRYYATESSLVFLSLQPVVAFRATDWLSLAAGPSLMYVDSRSKSAVNNLQPGLADGEIELEVDGIDAGVVVAAMIEARPGTRFAISYRNEQQPTLEGRPKFKGLGPLLQAALNRAGLLGADIDLDVNVPQTVQVGFYHEWNEKVAVMADLTWLDWSRFGKVDVTVNQFSVTARTDYNDIWVPSLGISYVIDETYRAGVGGSYVSSAVDTEDRTLSLPFDEFWIFGIGGSAKLRPGLELHGNLQGTISGNARIDQQSNPLAGRLRGRSRRNYSLFLGLSLVWGSS